MNLVLAKDSMIVDWLSRAGVVAQTVLLTPALLRPPTTGPAAGFAGWVSTPDYHGTVTELLAAELVLDLSIGRLAAIGEFDLLRAARLRELTGMPGQKFAEALRYRDKWMMKRLAAEGGATVPAMLLVEAVGTLPHRIGEIGLPAVVKPRWMPASQGVRVVRDFCEVTDVMRLLTRHVRPFELMVEAHIDAPVFHVDGLMRAGSVMVAWASQYWPEPMRAAILDEDEVRSDALLAAVSKVVAGLGSPDHVQAFHAEFQLHEDATPVLSEIACRCGGLGIPAMIEALTGIDPRRESLLGQLGLEHSPLGPRRCGSAGYVVEPGGGARVITGGSFGQVRDALC